MQLSFTFTMKCKYRFKIYGHLKPDVICPIKLRGLLYEFEKHNGIVTHICITIPIEKEDDLPAVIENPTMGVKLQIDVKTPRIMLIQQELRVIEGLLSFYGLRSIDIQNPDIEWLPENETEKERLKVFGFKVRYEEIKDSELLPLPFYLIAGSIIAADDAKDMEIMLSFYRKGANDMYDKRYIEAIYDFYFLLESIFGDGKTKNYAVKESFKKSTLLVNCIKNTITEPPLGIKKDTAMLIDFNKSYKNKTTDEVIEHIVDLRGFLHHHTSKRKDIWHPEDHNKFKLDALMLQDICSKVAFNLAGKYVFSDKVKQIYQGMLSNGNIVIEGHKGD